MAEHGFLVSGPEAELIERFRAGDVRGAIALLDGPVTPGRAEVRLTEAWAALGEDARAAAARFEPLVAELDAARGDPTVLTLALLGLGTARAMVGDAMGGAPPLERAIQIGVDPWVLAHGQRFLASTLEHREIFGEAAARYTAAAGRYRALGDAYGEANAEYGAGTCLMRLGRSEEAERQLRSAISRMEGIPNQTPLAPLFMTLALVLASRDPAEAATFLGRAKPLLGSSPLFGAEATVLSARLALIDDDPRRAIGLLADVSPPPGAAAREGALLLAEAWIRIGEPDLAEQSLPQADPALLGDLSFRAVVAAIAATRGDRAGLDRALAEVERALDRVRSDVIAIRALQLCVRRLEGDPDRAALALQLARRAGLAQDVALPQLVVLRGRGAGVPVGPFSVGDLLGEGGMGQVWRGVHRASGRDVALKVLRLDAGGDHGDLDALFSDEVAAVASLDHPHVVQTLAFLRLDAGAGAMLGQPEGSPCLVMEYMGGGVAARHADRWGWREVRQISEAMLGALAHAHARGVLHLDVKLDNVLLDATGNPSSARLSDFGLVGMMSRRSGCAFGTPAYLAPEQARGRTDEIGPWTDLYALGGLVWRLVTGETVFRGSDPVELLLAQCGAPIPPLVPAMEVPEGLEAWLRVLLEKAPIDRFETAADALAALSALGPARSPPGPSRSLAPAAVALPDAFGSTRITPVGDLSPLPPPASRPRPPPAPFPPGWRSIGVSPPTPFLSGLGEGLLAARVSPLVGRDEAVDLAWQALARIASGGPGACVLATGPPGVGRSHFLRAFGELCLASGAAEVVRLGAIPPGSGRRPRVVLADDLEPADLPVVTGWIQAGALVLAAAVRPPALHLEAGLALGPLSDLEVQSILDRLLPLERMTRVGLARRADGNPGFAVRLLRWLADRDQLVVTDEGFALRPEFAVSLPEDVRAIELARIEVLAPLGTERRAAWEIAATLGAGASEATWRAACLAAGVVPPVEALPPELGSAPFREALCAAAVSAGRAHWWHEACAEVSTGPGSDGRRGRHLVGAGRPADALPGLQAAAAEAVNVGNVGECQGLLDLWTAAAAAAAIPLHDLRHAEYAIVASQLAVHTGEDPLPRLFAAARRVEGASEDLESRVLCALGTSLGLRGDLPGSRAAWERAESLQTDLGSRLAGLVRMGLATTRFEAGEDATELALEACRIFAVREPLWVGRCHGVLGRGLARLGQHEQAEPWLRSGLVAARGGGWRAVEAELLWALHDVALARGDSDDARTCAHEAAEALRGTGSNLEIQFALRLASTLARGGNRVEAAELARRTEDRFSGRFSAELTALADETWASIGGRTP